MAQPQTPIPELANLADALQGAAEFYRKRTADIKLASPLSAPHVALTISWKAVRNVETVSILAKTDELLVPAAWSNARAACEIALRAIWLIHPADNTESHLRLLALVDENKRYHDRMLREKSPISYMDRHQAESERLDQFLERSRNEGFNYSPHVPKFNQIAEEIGVSQLIPLYIEASQYTHGAFRASELSPGAMPTEQAFPRHWIYPLRVCWLCLRELGKIMTFRLSLETEECDWSAHEPEIDRLFKALSDADPSD